MTGLGQVVFLQAVHSLDYLDALFDACDTGRVVAVVKDGAAQFSHPGLGEGPVIQPGSRLGWGRRVYQPKADATPAQVVFTSGTEGRPKAVVLSHANLADTVVRLNAVMALDASVREYVGVPVTFSFGLGRVRAVSAAGGAFYLPERFDPMEIRRMLEAGEINAISAVPSLWRIVLANPGVIGPAGDKVAWIEIGSQYMSGPEKAGMKALFPKARIVQHYGLTEASRTTFLQVSAVEDAALDSVGWVVGDSAVRIGPAGEICIKGPHVALGILHETGALTPLTDAEGWFHTSDKGEIRDGALWYQGRLDDQINITGVKLAAEGLERDIRTLVPSARDFAVTGVPDPLRGEAVLLALGPGASPARDLIRAAADLALRGHGIAQSGVLHLADLPALPLTETGKVQRKRLREDWVAQGSQTPEKAATDPVTTGLSPAQARVAAVWAGVVGQGGITTGQSFYQVGGDSLSAVQIGLAMEGADFPREAVRATLEGRTLAEVAVLTDGMGQTEGVAADVSLPMATVQSWAINATRGFMVLTVLLSHWGPGVIARLGIGSLVDPVVTPFSRMGTAGFASVFGLGMGFFMLPRLPAQRAAVAMRLRSSLVLVLVGLVLTGAAVLGTYPAAGIPFTAGHVAEAFYNVLAFYVLALVLALPCLSFLSHRKDPLPWAIGIAVALWPIGWGVVAVLPADPLPSVLEWPRLMLVAKYSLFRAGPMAFLGVAAGIWLSRQKDLRPTARSLMVAGAAGVGLSLVMAFETYGPGALSTRNSVFYNTVLGWGLDYAFALLAVGALMGVISHWHSLRPATRRPVQALIVIGSLALPIFAFHRIVIPLKDILAGLTGLSENMALLPPILAFLAAFAYGARRLWRMYFP